MRIALEPRGAFGHKLEDRRRLPVRAGSRPARPSPSTNKQLIEARGSRAEARCPVGGSVASGEWVRRQPPTADRHNESSRPGGITAPRVTPSRRHWCAGPPPATTRATAMRGLRRSGASTKPRCSRCSAGMPTRAGPPRTDPELLLRDSTSNRGIAGSRILRFVRPTLRLPDIRLD